jgi:HAL2 family 3'(2'),5'-bisphosphate nucleotidase
MLLNKRSPVTVADFAIQALISLGLQYINNSSSSFRLVAEESAEELRADEVSAQIVTDLVNQFNRHNQKKIYTMNEVLDAIDSGNDDGITPSFWTLDPIDGTLGFIRGDQYVVALAYIGQDGEIDMGLVGAPNLMEGGCIYVAVRDTKTVIYSLDGKIIGHPRCNHQSTAADTLFIESIAHTDNGISEKLRSALGIISNPIKMDSIAKYCCVSNGSVSVYPRIGKNQNIWDHAPGVILVQESGGRVTDARGNKLNWLKGRKLFDNFGVIASNGVLHDDILLALKEIL